MIPSTQSDLSAKQKRARTALRRHAWISDMVDKPPGEEPVSKHEATSWEKPTHVPLLTFTNGAYKPYSTCAHDFRQP